MTTTNTSMAIIAIVAALGLLGVVIMDVMLAAQVASAVPPPTKGCRNSLAANASQGHCFRG